MKAELVEISLPAVSLVTIGLGGVSMSLGQPNNSPSHPHDYIGNWLWDDGGCILWDDGGVILLGGI